MLQPGTFQFLQKLSKNNNREWFQQNLTEWNKAKDDFERFCSSLIQELGKYDKDIGTLEAKQTIFRLHRDVRFSNDKTPYKIHLGAYFNKGGKKVNTPGYYIQVQPGKSFLAGGLYYPEPKHLQAVRQEIDYNFGEWKKLINEKGIKKAFPTSLATDHKLQRPPKGYDASNPAIEFIKLKSFVFSTPVSDDTLMQKNAAKATATLFGKLYPIIQFLSRANEDAL